MFDSPEDIEHSIDIIGSTASLATATYKAAAAITAAKPEVGVILWTCVGVIWAARAIIRELQ